MAKYLLFLIQKSHFIYLISVTMLCLITVTLNHIKSLNQNPWFYRDFMPYFIYTGSRILLQPSIQKQHPKQYFSRVSHILDEKIKTFNNITRFFKSMYNYNYIYSYAIVLIVSINGLRTYNTYSIYHPTMTYISRYIITMCNCAIP